MHVPHACAQPAKVACKKGSPVETRARCMHVLAQFGRRLAMLGRGLSTKKIPHRSSGGKFIKSALLVGCASPLYSFISAWLSTHPPLFFTSSKCISLKFHRRTQALKHAQPTLAPLGPQRQLPNQWQLVMGVKTLVAFFSSAVLAPALAFRSNPSLKCTPATLVGYTHGGIHPSSSVSLKKLHLHLEKGGLVITFPALTATYLSSPTEKNEIMLLTNI